MMKQTKNNLSPFTCSGDKVAPIYKRVFDNKTKRSPVKITGDFDIYEFIQASNSKTDLSMLRQQMIETGQIPTVTDDVIDYSLFPENIHELHHVVNSAEQRFNALPDSIKNVFGTKDKFLAALTAGTYEQDIVTYYEKAAPVVNKSTEKVEESEK